MCLVLVVRLEAATRFSELGIGLELLEKVRTRSESKLELNGTDMIITLARKHGELVVDLTIGQAVVENSGKNGILAYWTTLLKGSIIVTALEVCLHNLCNALIGIELVQDELAADFGSIIKIRVIGTKIRIFVIIQIIDDSSELTHCFAEVTGCLAREGGQGLFASWPRDVCFIASFNWLWCN